MSRYCLDTNICIGLLKGEIALAARLRELAPDEAVVCCVVRAELYFGARKSARVEENLAVLRGFLAPMGSLAFDDLAAQHYGSIRAELSRSGTPIGNNDLLIASIARAHDCVVVTRNQGEFERVTGLRIEAWSALVQP